MAIPPSFTVNHRTAAATTSSFWSIRTHLLAHVLTIFSLIDSSVLPFTQSESQPLNLASAVDINLKAFSTSMAGICTDCITGDRLAGNPKGIMVNSLALPGYFSSANGSYDPPQYTKKALLISPDVFGFGLDNPKLLADIFAEKCGVDVWAADTFKGNAPVREDQLAQYLPDSPGQTFSWFTTIAKYLTILKMLPAMVAFRPSVQIPELVEFVSQLRKEYKYEKIGMIGYCWGGAHAVKLATMPGVIDISLPVHPGGGFKADMPNSVVPIAYFIPEEDSHWSPELLASIEEFKKRAGAPKHSFKVYPGTTHGFGSRPNLSIPKVKESWEEYISDTVAWVKETL